MSSAPKSSKVLSGTSGAVPMRNEKGEIYMQKVKVDRYVAGKRPKYAPESDEENEEERAKSAEENESSEDERVAPSTSRVANLPLKTDVNDRRLKRLNQVDRSADVSEEARRRHVAEPEILKEADDMEIESEEEEVEGDSRRRGGDESDEEEIDEEERARRRAELKKRALQRQEELLAREEEGKTGGAARRGSDEESDEDEDESEYEDEEYSDEDDESSAPRLKPVFIRKDARVTIQEQEKEKEREKQLQLERDRLHQENKKHTRKIIQDEISREKLAERETDDKIACDFKTDDEDNEKEYEEWKLRELKRIKRDREEKENEEKEKQEIQKIRNMTEEERAVYFKQNPKLVTNQNVKGKYKFLQKYYHRGAFYIDEDAEVFKRNFAQPTLEDKFDKTILPKVMQVKNFGMAGRTKYTHLMDQDTSAKQTEENPWAGQEKFISGKGGGTKQVFDKPTAKKRK